MITITNIRNAQKDAFDEVWAIVRSLKSKSAYITQVPELSPSWSLFKTYFKLIDDGNWNKQTFETIYKPQFLSQIANDPAASKKLTELIQKDKAGKKIALVCFCTDPTLCHRSLIAQMLTNYGVKVTLS